MNTSACIMILEQTYAVNTCPFTHPFYFLGLDTTKWQMTYRHVNKRTVEHG